jgi:hypothetical protein
MIFVRQLHRLFPALVHSQAVHYAAFYFCFATFALHASALPSALLPLSPCAPSVLIPRGALFAILTTHPSAPPQAFSALLLLDIAD